MINFSETFNPLEAAHTTMKDMYYQQAKKSIENILASYSGIYDCFAELIQNALDSIEYRLEESERGYIGKINIKINLQENRIAITDNGLGFNKENFTTFMAPNITFKTGGKRGYKGVGCTYLAYGFNQVQVSTKNKTFTATCKVIDGKKWVKDKRNTVGVPEVFPDTEKTYDEFFDTIDKGVSVSIAFDNQSIPQDMVSLGIKNAESWHEVLKIKTGIGAIKPNSRIQVSVCLIKENGEEENFTQRGISCFDISKQRKTISYKELNSVAEKLFAEKGQGFTYPSKYKDIVGIYERWEHAEIAPVVKVPLNRYELEIIDRHKPIIILSYVYSTSVWKSLNESFGLDDDNPVIHGGIQLAADNMPQGDLIQIPLTKNIGRQKQAHFVFHFENCEADMGRKKFQKSIEDFAKDISRKILDNPIRKYAHNLKRSSGEAHDIGRQNKIDEWTKQMLKHEEEKPLLLNNPNFFVPVNQISITSEPSREQEVISLFNQLLAGGVIRGISLLSTNEKSIYDGLFRFMIKPPHENLMYDETTNPLGINKAVLDTLLDGKTSLVMEPKVIEYKFSLDGLIEDIDSHDKNIGDIRLVVAWEAGKLYKESYSLKSLFVYENCDSRQIHGVTHELYDERGQFICFVILLKDLIQHLNDKEQNLVFQSKEYEDI